MLSQDQLAQLKSPSYAGGPSTASPDLSNDDAYQKWKQGVQEAAQTKSIAPTDVMSRLSKDPTQAISDYFGGYIPRIIQAGKTGIQQAKTAINEGSAGTINPLEAGIRAVSGIANVVQAPIAPAMNDLTGPIIDKIGNTIGDIPAVQKFANSSAGETTSRVAEDVAAAGNIAGTILGANQVAKTVPTIPGIVNNAVDTLKSNAVDNMNTLSDLRGEVKNAAGYVKSKIPGVGPSNTPEADIVDKYTKAIKPTVVGKKTPQAIEAYNKNVVSGVHSIVNNEPNLKYTNDLGEEIAGRTPQSPMEMNSAINQTKEQIFSHYDALTKEATGKGATIDTKPIAGELDRVINNEAIKTTHPEAVAYAQKLQERLQTMDAAGRPTGEYRLHDPATTQEIIKIYNNDLEAFYRNPTYGDASKAAIDAGVVSGLRKQLASTIESATGSADYQTLKKQYGALSAIEADVAKRAIVIARQSGKGLADYANVFSGGDMVHGILSMNPALFAKGAAQGLFTKWYRWLNSPDRAITNMFEGAKLNMPSGLKPPTEVTPAEPPTPIKGNPSSPESTAQPPESQPESFNSPAVGKTVTTPQIQNPLTTEAQKYKTAEEFVKDKTTTLYRAAPNFPTDEFQKGTYFADTPEKARFYSESHYGGNPQDIKVQEFTLPKDKIFREPSTGNTLTTGTISLKTKSQLTDIWNKANATVGSQPASIESVLKLGVDAKTHVDSVAQELADKHGISVSTAPLKKAARIQEKADSDYGGDIGKVKDVARNTLVAGNHKIEAVLADLKARPDFVGYKEQKATDFHGYSGHIVNLKAPNGLTSEMQVNTPEMIYAKEKPADAKKILGVPLFNKIAEKTGIVGGQGHVLYARWRSPIASIQEKDLLSRGMAKYYNAIRSKTSSLRFE